MDSLPTPTDVSTSKAPSLATGFLSQLNSLFGGQMADSGVFASLLATQQEPVAISPSPKPDVSTSPTQNTPSQGSNDVSGNNQTSTGSLKTLVVALRHIINKLNRDGANTASSSSSKDNTNTRTSDAATAANASVNQTQTTASTTSSVTSGASSSDNTSSDNGNVADSKPLAGILSELSSLMKLMEKKLQDAQASANTSSGGTDATAQTSNAANSSSATNAGTADPLTQLLALMQIIQQKLTETANNALPGNAATLTTTAPNNTSAGTQAPTSISDVLQELSQVQKDLKGLMSSLQDASGISAQATDNAGNTNDAGAMNTAADGSSNLPNQTALLKSPLATADNIFGLLGGAIGSTFTNTPAPSPFASISATTLVATADAPISPVLDVSAQNNATSDNSGSANLGSLAPNSTGVSGQTDATRAADPYAFASQLSAARAANGGTTGLPGAVEQVLLQMNRGVKDGNDQMTIQLHPAELGKISIKLDISSDGNVQGTIVADNPSTLNMLHKDVRSLERALQEAGLRADPGSLQFNLSGQSGNTSGQTANNSSNTASNNNSSLDTSGTSLDVSTADDETYYLTPGRVNFKV